MLFPPDNILITAHHCSCLRMVTKTQLLVYCCHYYKLGDILESCKFNWGSNSSTRDLLTDQSFSGANFH